MPSRTTPSQPPVKYKKVVPAGPPQVLAPIAPPFDPNQEIVKRERPTAPAQSSLPPAQPAAKPNVAPDVRAAAPVQSPPPPKQPAAQTQTPPPPPHQKQFAPATAETHEGSEGDSLIDGFSTVQDGRYQIMRKLGTGGTGRIFLARDEKMGYEVVLKELHPVSSSPETLKYLEKRFMEEAKLLFRLNHAGFPRVIDYFTEKGRLFIIMQYIQGSNLYTLLMQQPGRKFPLETCTGWLGKMLELLIILQSHEPPIIHRDIKPANMMLDNNGQLYLVDFGFARVVDPEGSQTRVGTFGYASPEHFSGKFVVSSDIFSLGATFHHLLTGENPQQRKDPFRYPPITNFVPDFPEDMQKIFDKMMNLSKAFRYQNAAEAKADLDLFREKYNI
jgi:serine/threonine-protein kinase